MENEQNLNSERTTSAWSVLPFLAMLLALAVFPRIVGLPGEILSHDELASWRFGQGDLLELLRNVAALDCHPPFFYLLQWLSEAIFGPGGAGSRLPVLLASLAGIPAVYLLGAAWFDRRTGLLAAALLAVHPWHVHLARDVRMYSLLFFLGCLLYASLPAVRQGNRRALYGAALLSTFLLLTHYFAVWLVLTALVLLRLPGGERGWVEFKRHLLPCLVLPLLIFLSWVIFAMVSLQQRGHFPLTWGLVHPGSGLFLDFLNHADWCETGSFFRWQLFVSVSPLILLLPRFRTLAYMATLSMLWLPLLGIYLTTTIIAGASGAGTWQATFAAAGLAPLLVLASRAAFVLRPGILLLVVASALLLRPCDTLAVRLASRPLSPWPVVTSSLLSMHGSDPVLLISPGVFQDDLAELDRRGFSLTGGDVETHALQVERLLASGADPLLAVVVTNLDYTAGPAARLVQDIPDGYAAATAEVEGERKLVLQVFRPMGKALQIVDPAGKVIRLNPGQTWHPPTRNAARAQGALFTLLRYPGVLDGVALLWLIGLIVAGFREEEEHRTLDTESSR